MHVIIPRTIYASFQRTFNVDIGSAFINVKPWLIKPEDIKEAKGKTTLYFAEKRRPDYSDVCHSKVITGDVQLFDDAPIGSYEFKYGSSTYYLSGCIDLPSSRDKLSPAWTMCLANGKFTIFCQIHATWRSGGQQRINTLVGVQRWKSTSECYEAYTEGYIDVRRSDSLRIRSSWTRNYLALADDVERLATSLSSWNFPSLERGNQEVRSIVLQLLDMAYLWVQSYPGFTNNRSSLIAVQPARMENAPQFLLHEPEVIMEGYSDIMFGRGFEAYYRTSLVEQAFLDAFTHVPRLNENSISNLLEITSFIKSLVVDHQIEIPKSLSELWLSYRYQYSTTKLDAEQAIEFVHRHMDLGDWSSIKAYGESSITYNDVPIRCRCSMEISQKTVTTVGKAWRALYTYGLEPNFYVIWDMIPYSFIVDWFIPIGDVMAAWDAERSIEQFYDIKCVNFSLSYEQVFGLDRYSFYTRWLSEPPKALHGYYFLESGGPSDKTIIKRILDATSLVLG